ncbi:hypothetical protein TMatcc_001884 [Talaromyces marneffei ATCC 18224]
MLSSSSSPLASSMCLICSCSDLMRSPCWSMCCKSSSLFASVSALFSVTSAKCFNNSIPDFSGAFGFSFFALAANSANKVSISFINSSSSARIAACFSSSKVRNSSRSTHMSLTKAWEASISASRWCIFRVFCIGKLLTNVGILVVEFPVFVTITSLREITYLCEDFAWASCAVKTRFSDLGEAFPGV